MISNLPGEILQKIFSKLNKADLKSVRLVCRRWFRLSKVETISIDPSTCYMYRKLLVDFDGRPEFFAGLKKLIVKNLDDDHDCYENEDRESLCLVDNHLASIVKYCCNLTGVEMNMNCSKNLLEHLEQLKQPQQLALQDKLDLTFLRLNLTTCDVYSFHSHSSYNKKLSLNQLFEHFGSSLLSFTITQTAEAGNIDYFSIGCNSLLLNFIYECTDNSKKTMLIHLEKIEIIGGCYSISKACLEYFISGQLGRLNTLNLCLRVQDTTNGTEEDIWDHLKEYCKSCLKQYNILLVENFTYSTKILFTFDNCSDKEDSYNQLYLSEVAYSPTENYEWDGDYDGEFYDSG